MTRSISFVVPGQAVQFARAGSRGARRFTPAPQRNYMAAISYYAAIAMNGEPPFDGPVKLVMVVQYLIPCSWSKKRRDRAFWKTSAPDADNLAKIAKDAMSKIVYQDDAQVACLIVHKQYGPLAQATIIVGELA